MKPVRLFRLLAAVAMIYAPMSHPASAVRYESYEVRPGSRLLWGIGPKVTMEVPDYFQGMKDRVPAITTCGAPGWPCQMLVSATADLQDWMTAHLEHGYPGQSGNTAVSMWGRLHHAALPPSTAPQPTCLVYILSSVINRQNNVYWTSPCLPITVVYPQNCSLTSASVLLDHGVITRGETGHASDDVVVHCTEGNEVRLSLADGTSRIPLGGGWATLATDRGALGSVLRLSAGDNRIRITSSANGVAEGAWSSSSTLLMDVE